MRRRIAAALVALAWSGDAQAAAPVADPATPPAITVANGPYAYGAVHPADGDTFRASVGGWAGVGNSYSYRWQRCTTRTSGCSDLPGATGPVMVADSLFGGHLRVAVTATNADGSATAFSAATAVLADERSHLIDPARAPAVTGTLQEGATVAFDPEPYFTGSRPLSVEVIWERCTGPTDWHECLRIPHPGGRNTTLVLGADDVGKYLRAEYWVLNGARHGSVAYSPRVGPVARNTSPPALAQPPVVTAPDGTAEGSVLQAQPGTWTGGKPIGFAYQWLRCDSEDCTELAGETSSHHTATGGDVGHRLKVRVTATNAYGSGVATTGASPEITIAPPAPAAPPVVDGTTLDGQILAGTRGTFSGTGPFAETVGWERCDADGDACTTIPGATHDAYTLVPGDIGRRLRFKVTATNSAGSAHARSAATAVVRAIAPTPNELPAVAGQARDEQTLEGSSGAWSGSPDIVLARQWMRCADSACAPIAGATGATYAITSADVGSRLRLRVTATNFGNAVIALSEPTAVVVATAPHAITAPALTGTPRDGEVLSATEGVWGGTGPLARSHRWERCRGAACQPIEGVTASTYRLAGADVGARVRAVVTAAGPGGRAEAASAQSDLVAAVAPFVEAAPEVAGEARDGATLTATAGTWGGSLPMSVVLRWERCTPACAPIAGATGTTYAAVPADVGHRLRVVQRAENAGGSAESASTPTAVVAARPPSLVAGPEISGSARDGQTLTATAGEWAGTPEIVLSRQWLRCTSATGLNGCEAVPGARGPSHALSGDDVGAFMRVRLFAANAAGTVTAESAAVGPVAPAVPSAVAGEGPVLTIPGDPDPSAPDVGDRVVVENGRWTGTDRAGHALSFTYRWERCDAGGCHEIPGRTGAAETATADDAGRQLRVVVTATSPSGSASQATPRLGITRAAPMVVPAPPAPAAPGPAAPAPGGPLGTDACRLVGRRTLRAGGVRLTVPAGTASAAQPLVTTLAGPRSVKRITLKAGARGVRVVRAGRGRWTAALKPAVLARSQLLQLSVVPRRGRPAKASGRLTVKPCQALLTVRLRGRRLSLRVDQRAPIGGVTFTLPKRLAVVGTSLAAQPGGDVRLSGRRVQLPSLPPGTNAVTLSVELAGRARGRALRFSAATDTARLTSSASVRR